jgi:hypothetical protein
MKVLKKEVETYVEYLLSCSTACIYKFRYWKWSSQQGFPTYRSRTITNLISIPITNPRKSEAVELTSTVTLRYSLHTGCCKILPITHPKEKVRVNRPYGKGKGGRSCTPTITPTLLSPPPPLRQNRPKGIDYYLQSKLYCQKTCEPFYRM